MDTYYSLFKELSNSSSSYTCSLCLPNMNINRW